MRIDNDKTGFDKYAGLYYGVITMILKSMNVTATTKLGPSDGYIDENGEPRSCLKDVFYGTVDVYLDSNMLTLNYPARAYPFGSSGLKIASIKEHVGYLKRFIRIFTLQFWIFFLVCCLVSVISLKYFVKQSAMAATLEFIRVFTNVSTLKIPLDWSNKMLFVLFIFAIFYINIIMQCYLQAFTTAPDRAPTIDSFDDLVKFNLSIGGASYYKDLMIADKQLSDRYHVMDFKECIERIKNGRHIACVMGKLTMRYLVHESEILHISKNSFFETQVTFLFKEDWSLLRRFDRLLLRASEGGFINFHLSGEECYYSKNTEDSLKHENAINEKMFQVAFFILVCGWTLSICITVIEITIHNIIIKYNQYFK